MEFTVKETKPIEEKRHNGTITKIPRRVEPFDYPDLTIKIQKPSLTINESEKIWYCERCGCAGTLNTLYK